MAPAGQAAGLFPDTKPPPPANAGQKALPARQCCQHQSTIMRDQFLCQTLDIHRLLAKLCQLGQCCGTVLRFQCVRNAEQITAVGHTCHAAHHIGIDFRRNACAGIQNGQRIAQCTVGQTGDQFRTVRRKLQLFLTCNVFHPAGDILRPDAGKIVPLAAGKNGGGTFWISVVARIKMTWAGGSSSV